MQALHARLLAAERRLAALEAQAQAGDTATAALAVRPTTSGDSAAVAALVATCFKDAMAAVPSVKRYMERSLRGFDVRREYGVGQPGHGGRCWVAEGPRGVVGCVGLKAGGDSSGAGGAGGAGGWEVSHLCVHPSCRGRGLAKALLAALLAHARAAAYTHTAGHRHGPPPAAPLQLHLTVLSDVQRPAWGLYKSVGFHDVGAPVLLAAAAAGHFCKMQHMVRPVEGQ